eukprot:7375856-Prymnesium_polylepis.2
MAIRSLERRLRIERLGFTAPSPSPPSSASSRILSATSPVSRQLDVRFGGATFCCLCWAPTARAAAIRDDNAAEASEYDARTDEKEKRSIASSSAPDIILCS